MHGGLTRSNVLASGAVGCIGNGRGAAYWQPVRSNAFGCLESSANVSHWLCPLSPLLGCGLLLLLLLLLARVRACFLRIKRVIASWSELE